jgi:hypothetical protein
VSRGRLEARITFASNQVVSLTVTTIGGPSNVTIAPAGSYYPTDLLSTIKTALDAAFGGDGAFTVTGSFGESGTGLVTISHATQTFTLAWTSTNVRDALGFASDLTPAALTFTGTKNAQGVFLPGVEGAFAYGNGDEGHTETDMTTTESPRGDVKALVYNTRQVLPSVIWSHVDRSKARIAGETTTDASFEAFWRKCQGGELSYFQVLAPIRLYWSADVASYKTYRLPGRNGTEMPRTVEEWNGLYRIEITRLVRVPGT